MPTAQDPLRVLCVLFLDPEIWVHKKHRPSLTQPRDFIPPRRGKENPDQILTLPLLDFWWRNHGQLSWRLSGPQCSLSLFFFFWHASDSSCCYVFLTGSYLMDLPLSSVTSTRKSSLATRSMYYWHKIIPKLSSPSCREYRFPSLLEWRGALPSSAQCSSYWMLAFVREGWLFPKDGVLEHLQRKRAAWDWPNRLILADVHAQLMTLCILVSEPFWKFTSGKCLVWLKKTQRIEVRLETQDLKSVTLWEFPGTGTIKVYPIVYLCFMTVPNWFTNILFTNTPQRIRLKSDFEASQDYLIVIINSSQYYFSHTCLWVPAMCQALERMPLPQLPFLKYS